jgi:AcrR family transcriptional regulator
MTQTDRTSRERIAEAAFELISARGMAGVTMSAIAAGAGVARQTLYNHFADVEGIVLWAVDQYEAAGMEQLRQIVAATEGPAAQLEQLVRLTVVERPEELARVATELVRAVLGSVS